MFIRAMIWLTLGGLLLACGGGGSGSAEYAATSHYSSESVPLTSRIMQYDYPLTVQLPTNYGTTQDALPVILVLDGIWHQSNVANSVAATGTRAIIVGIGNNQRREPDFIPPAFNGELSGMADGDADHYVAMLRDEILPLLEQRYRIDPSRRYLVGHSLGGLLVEYALLTDNPNSPLFHGYFASDASNFNYEYLANLETLFYPQTKSLPVKFFIASASHGNGLRAEYVGRLMEEHHYPGLDLTIRSYETDHNGVMSLATPEAMQFFFPPSAATAQ